MHHCVGHVEMGEVCGPGINGNSLSSARICCDSKAAIKSKH